MKRSHQRVRLLALLVGVIVVVGPATLGVARPGGSPGHGLVFRPVVARADAPAILVHSGAGDRGPRVLFFAATPATLPAAGGVVRLRAVVENATSCRFTSAQGLQPLPAAVGCHSGTASIRVTLAQNTSAAARSYSFGLSISGQRGKRTARRVEILESGAQPSSTAPAATTPTASTPPSTTTAAATPAETVPEVTAVPASETVVEGDVVSLTAAAMGSPTPTVQWMYSTDAGSTWAPAPGASATSTTYSFAASLADNGYEYEAIFTNSAGSAKTDPPATINVTAQPGAPQVTAEPASDSVAPPAVASFVALASGSPTPSVQWQVSIDGGTSWGNVAGATSTTYAFATSGQEDGYEYRAVFTNEVGSTTTSTATLTILDQPSSNWSGYVATGGTFSAVSASWIVPTTVCSERTTYSAQWIGIDGDPSDSVEQDGTEADCFGGTASYDAWYEIYGDDALDDGDEVELSPASYPVAPGDAISASVNFSNGVWTLAVADGTENWQFSTPVAWPGAAQSSAEWIAERPEVGSRLSSLADFGSVTFNAATATDAAASGPISDFSNVPIEMTGAGDVLAAPGQLDPAGSSFTDTWLASS